jgi:D-3-phosphoglycerate dehydrogenase
MKVLIVDKLPGGAAARLRAEGCAVVEAVGLKGDALVEALRREDPDVLVVRSTKVTQAHLDANARLSLVVRAGAGVNTIDVEAASARGIYVSNCPGKNAEAVAELAFGLLLCADRQIPNATRDLRAGQWRKKHYSQAQGLYGRTLGLLGMGYVGRAMALRARAFGMQVVAWSRSLGPEEARALGIGYAASPLEVAAAADFVSVHVALSAETEGLIDDAFIDAMRPGAVLINTARGEVAREESLLRGVQEKGLRCGLDVWAQEPAGDEGELSSALLAQEQVYGTCHVAASTEQAQEAVAAQAVAIALAWHQTGVVPCCVNLARRSRASHMLVVRHRDRVGVLAQVLDVLRRDEVNVQEMENIIFDGGEAAVARIRLGCGPSAAAQEEIQRAQHVLAVDLLPLTQDKA